MSLLHKKSFTLSTMELMQAMRCFLRAVILSVLAFFLAACSLDTTRQPIAVNLPSQSLFKVDGQWADSEGNSTSSFRNGIFETRSSDTFEKLSEGNYVMRENNLVEIEMRSLVRGTVSRVNCAVHASAESSPQLMCTSQEGVRFTLHRQEGNRSSSQPMRRAEI